MWDSVELALIAEQEAIRAEEEAFEQYLAWLVGRVDRIDALSDEDVLFEFREDGGDPELGAQQARRSMLAALVVDRSVRRWLMQRGDAA